MVDTVKIAPMCASIAWANHSGAGIQSPKVMDQVSPTP